MEESVSPELAQAPEPELSQDPVDTSSQEPTSVSKEVKDQKDQGDVSEDKVEDPDKSTKPPREFKKTWGFRRTTIAKREIPGEMAETPEGRGAPVRRSGRQAKRTDKLEEFLVTVKRGRGTGRRSCPSRLEGGDPPSQTPTDAETASEASFDGNADAKIEEQKVASPEKKKSGRGRTRRAVKPKAGGGSVSDDGSSENEEKDSVEVMKETQENVETAASAEDGKDEKEEQVKDVEMKEEEGEEECNKNIEETSNESLNRRPTRAVCKDSKRDTKPKVGVKLRNEKKDDEDDDEESSSSDSDSDGYDPNALYCICRQKHNKRFMICCDRCEEWFHGNCVGISEARGRLMERNGEDYVCPNCYTQKGQFSKAGSSTAAAENGKRPAAGLRKSETGLATPSSTAAATTEEKTSDDLGIKGRIEKATNPSGKKKIKIFQPVTAVEGSSLPKCIGPGCERDALPDSVYCGNDCILRHAAAAMKTITTDGKGSKLKERVRPKAQKKTSNKSPNKRSSGPERRSSNQGEEESESGTEEFDDDDEDKHAEEHPPPPAMSSWSSDHNYIAVSPEKTTPISASVLNKTSAAQKDKEKEDNEEVKPEKETASADKKPPASNIAPKGGKKSPGYKGTKAAAATSPLPKAKATAAPLNSGRELRKQPIPIQGKSKKPGPPPPPIPVLSPSGLPGSRHHATGALRVGKSTFTIPKKQPQAGQKDSAEPGPSPTTRTPPSPGSSIQHSAPKPTQAIAAAAPSQPPPNNQMRSNIRRSLTDILYKRVSDSDDLSMSENEVGKLAVGIEKEMFNLYMNTDNKYKNKYRSLMFNLKDPKNKGLFYRVVRGEISPFRLVRLSPEELLSREMSDWRKSEISESLDMSGRSQSGQPKSGSRQEGAPPDVDMEEAPPPMSDGDDSQEEARPTSVSQAPVSTGKSSSMPDIFSSMLKDTTAEHRAHLFDLNCKICTGQKLADDEPPSKKNKMSAPKKPEHSFKSKLESRPSKSPADLPQVSSLSGPETPMPDSAAVMEDPSSVFPVVQAPVTAAVPAVSSVTITRRDPRTAGHRSSVPQIVPDVVIPAMPANIPISVEPVVVEAKGPLPMPPPAPASIPRPVIPKTASYGSSTTSMSEPPPEGETALFLSGQEMMWKGFINMHSVAKFVTKAYLVSGSFEHIKEDLPDTIHIGGRISPHTVWDYVGKLKTSLSKELSLIRFHPATEEEEVAYVSLFSYFSSRKRFGVVANSNKRIKDLYLIPLSSKDPLPAKLLPFDGPGLEPARPNLLLGLLICQKDKKRPGAPLENEEKRSKTLRDDETGLPKPSTTGKSEIKQDKVLRSSLDAISTTPPGTPPPLSASESSSSVSSVFSILSSVKAPGVSTSTGSNSPSSNVSAASTASSTPLQTILKTLFGQKKQDSDVSLSPSDQSAVDVALPSVSLFDPIVQQFAITKGKEVEVQDDRPYDPEEEYDPAVGYGTENTHDTTKVSAAVKQAEVTPVMDDVAYDPEDDSLFDDVGVDPSTKKLTEHQKVLEEKQIEEQKHEEPVHQQIPDTLISQPVTSLLANSQLLQLGKKVEELVAKTSAAPVINQRRDPRQSRDPRQAVISRRQTSVSTEAEEESSLTTDKTSPNQGTVTETSPTQACTVADTQIAQLDSTEDTSVEEPSATTDMPLSQVTATLDSVQSAILDPEASKSEERGESEEGSESEEVPFLDTKSTEVSIPLLGEKIDPELVESYIEEEPKTKGDPIESEIKSFEEVWPNSASILKADQVSSIGHPIETTTTTYYNISTISTSSTSLHSGVPQDVIQDNSSYMDSHSSHIQHIPTTNPNITPPMSFPPPILGPPPMQGPPPIAVPPPMHLPPSMSGPPPMQIPPMQGPLPPLVDNDHSQYPPPGSYPPFQNQWGSSSQFDAAPRGPLPTNFTPRGPSPFQPMGQRGPPHQIFDNSMNSLPPQHIGPRGPPPGPPPPRPPPSFDGQRFNGPPPPFNFSAPRGPPPPFPGPPPNHFDNRAPPPSHFPGPRGPPPLHNIGDRGPPSNMSRGPGDQFEDGGNSYHQRMEKPQIPSQGPPFRVPLPNHFDGRRGPPGPSGEMSGQQFPPPNQFRGSPQHRGSFEEPRGTSSQDFEKHRGPSVQQFGGLRGPPPGHYDKEPVGQPARFNYNDDTPSDVRDVRPVRGPLLPTPSEGPIPIQGRIGGHSPDSHRDDHWRRHSPEMRRRSCSTRDSSEPHNRPSRFDGGSRDRDASSRLSEERQRDLLEDRRRDRDREGGHGGRSWGWNREHEYDRGREKDRERDRSRERDKERERGRSRERESEHSRERDRSRGRESDRYRDGDGDKRRDRDRDRDRGREREQDRKDHDRDRAKNRDRERDRDRDRDSRDRRRERSRSRERERGKDRDRRDRDRERDKDRGRDRRDRSRSKEKKDDKKERSDNSRAKSKESENPS